MRNDYSSEGIIKAMETLAEATKPYQAAMEVLKHNTEMFAGLGNSQISKLGAMNSALTRGLFDERLAKSISGLLTPYYELTGARTCACHCERFVNNANDLNSIDILTDISYWS